VVACSVAMSLGKMVYKRNFTRTQTLNNSREHCLSASDLLGSLSTNHFPGSLSLPTPKFQLRPISFSYSGSHLAH